jgi:hypothetical protein
MRFLLFFLLLLTSCAAKKDADTNTGAPASSTSPPVSSAPLAGVVGGQAFTGKVGLALYGTATHSGEVFVFDRDKACANFFETIMTDHWEITLAGPWQSGMSGDVGLLSPDAMSVTFEHVTVTDDAVTMHYAYAEDGRIEILEAPTEVGAVGRIRARATSAEGHHIEGEIPFELCVVDANH